MTPDTGTVNITITPVEEAPVIYQETVVADEDFEGGATGWSDNTTSTDGEFTEFLGEFARMGATTDQDISKTYTLSGDQEQVVIEFDMYEINDWDNELFRVFIDDVEIFNHQLRREDFDVEADGTNGNISWEVIEKTSGTSDLGFRADREDQIITYRLTIDTTAASIKLGFGTSLNSTNVNDEAWGIDNVLVKERVEVGTSDQSFTVPETAAIGDKVGTLGAVDPEGLAINYSITGGTGAAIFAIDASGNITVTDNSAFDFEGGPNSYTLDLQVQEAGGGMLTDTQTITINIIDIDEAPEWTPPASPFATIAENSVNGTSVGTVAATDPDGDTITYRIVGGNNLGVFAIDGTTGEITVADETLLNFEDNPSYNLNIRAYSGTGTVGTIFTDQIFVIDLSDVDEAPVVDPADIGQALDPDVVYNPATGNYYKFVQANVNWATASGIASTSMLNGVGGHLLTIDSVAEQNFIMSQSLFTNAAGNRLLDDAWLGLTDQAVEGEWRWSGGANDGTLIWQGDENGNVLPGEYVNWRNGQPNDFGGTGQDFAIIRRDGEWEDFATGNTHSYIIEWEGEDVINNTDYTVVTTAADASDVNDGDSVGFFLGADPEGDTVNYSITAGNAAGVFTIDGSTGEITINDASAINAATTYSLTIRTAEDNGTNQFTDHVITVEFDTGLTALTNNPITIVENTATTTITTADLNVTDPDSAATDVIFTVTDPTDEGFLQLSTAPGTAILSFTLDDLQNNRVEYVHGGSEVTTDTFNFDVTDGADEIAGNTFTINITLVNDAPELILASSADILALDPALQYNAANGNFYKYVNTNVSFAAAEAAAAADLVLGQAGHLVTITDAAENAFVAGIITNNTWLGATDVASEGYWLWVAGPENGTQFSFEDFTVVGQYQNWANNEPNNNGAGEDYAQIRTNGQWNDIAGGTNHYVIEWSGDDLLPLVATAQYNLAEDAANGTSIFTPNGSNEETSQTVTYTIESGNTDGIFAIDPATGEVTVTDNTNLNFEVTTSYDLVIRITDDGPGTLFDEKTVRINITDVDDAPVPVNNTGITVNEGTRTTTELTSTDEDTAAADIDYTVTSTPTNGWLELEGNIGTPITSFTQDDLDNNRVVYYHDGSETTTDSFTFTVGDATTTLAADTFNITITPVNDAPIIVNTSPDPTSALPTGNIVFHLDPTVGVTAAGNDVTGWTDQQGGDQNGLTENGTVQTGIDTINGVNALTFDGASTLSLNNDPLINDANPITGRSIFMVLETGADVSTRQMIYEQGGGTNGFGIYIEDNKLFVGAWKGTGNNFSIYHTVDIDANTVYQTGFVFDSGTDHFTAYLNGEAFATAAPGEAQASHTGDITIGGNGNTRLADGTGGGGDRFTGKIGDIVYYSDAVNTTDVDAIHDYFDAKYNNVVTVLEAGTVAIDTNVITENDPDDAGTDLTYTVTSAPTNGQLEFTSAPGVAVNSFTQDDLDNNLLVYVHDGSDTTTDSFDISLIDNGEDGVSPDTSTVHIAITPVDDAPVLTNNGLTVNEGSTTTISTAELTATDPDTAATAVIYTVTAVPTNGQLELTTGPGVAINSFTQDDLDNNRVVYVHDGGETISDSFTFTLADGTTTAAGNVFNLTVTPVNDAPVLTNNTGAVTDVDFSTATIVASPGQDGASGHPTSVNVLDSGNTIQVAGNAWKAVDFGGYTVTANTVIEFEFRSTDEGEIHGFSFSNDTSHQGSPTDLPFQLFGTDTTANIDTTYNDYTLADGWKSYSIPVGTFGTGAFANMIFFADDDAAGSAESFFRNVKIYESGTPTIAEAGTLNITTAHIDATDPDDSGTELTYSVSAQVNGRVQVSGVDALSFTQDDLDNNRVTFIHDGSETLTASFDITLEDGNEDASAPTTETFHMVITPTDDAPALTNNGLTVDEGSTTTISTAELTSADPDSDPEYITYDITSATSNGQLELTTAPGVAITSFTQDDLDNNRVVYVHDDSETTSDSFTFTLSDGTTTTTGNVFNLTVTPVNEAPTITTNTGFTLAEAGTQTIGTGILDSTDVDDSGTGLTYSVTSAPANGQLELTTAPGVAINSFTQDDLDNNRVVYIHDGSDTIADSFDISLADGGEDLVAPDTATVNITITPVDDAPVLTNNGLTVNEGSTTTISTAELTSTDPDTAATDIDYNVTSVPANGQLELTTAPGVAITTFTQDDLDNNRVVYVHDGGETISDSFTFTMTDGTTPLAGQTFNLTVTPVNDAPTITTNAGINTTEGGTAAINTTIIDATDPDDSGTGLTYTVTSAPANGQLELTTAPGVAINSFTQDDLDNNRVRYVHDASDTVADSFDISLADGGEDLAAADTATVNITINAVDDAPVLSNNGLTATEGLTTTITTAELDAADSDTAAAAIDFTITSAPVNGQLELTTAPGVAINSFTQDDLDNNRVVYVHDGTETTTDSFTFNLTDGTTPTTGNLFNIAVTPVNEAPTISTNTSFTLNEGATQTIDTTILDGTDPDDSGTGLTYTVTSAPANGQLELTTAPGVAINSFTQDDLDNNRVVYVHDGSETIADSFDISLADGGENLAAPDTATVNITITPVDDAPVLTNNGLTLLEGATGTISTAELDAVDPDTAAASVDFTVTSAPVNGQLELTTAPGVAINSFTQDDLDNNRVVYVHDGGETTSDSFTFTLSDGNTTTTGNVFNLTVTPVNDAPVATVLTPTINEDVPLNLTFTDLITDPEPALLNNLTFSNETNGTITYNNATGDITFTPDPNYFGAASFDFSYTNAGGLVANGTVNITVNAVNDAPVFAGDITGTLAEDSGSTTGTVTATDVELDPVTFSIGTAAGNGVASVTPGGDWTYTPNLNFFGTDTFVITADDGNGGTTDQTITITVTPTPDPATLVPFNETVTEDNTLVFSINDLVFDPDGDADPTALTFTRVTNGTMSINTSTGDITFRPSGNFNGTASFEYEYDDVDLGITNTLAGDGTIEVTEGNDAPEITKTEIVQVVEGEIAAITTDVLDGLDIDDGPLSFTYNITGGLEHGQLELVTNRGVAITSFTQHDLNSGLVIYVHDGSEASTDIINFELKDGGEDGAIADTGDLFIQVIPVNDAPVLENNGLTLAEGARSTLGSDALALDDPDTNADALIFTVTTAPTHGQLELASNPGVAITSFTQADLDAGRVIYAHDGSETIADQFSFTATDGIVTLDEATLELTILPVNDAPEATEMPVILLVTVGVEKIGQLPVIDVDDTVLSYSVSQLTEHGTLILNAATGGYSYTPNDPNYFGPDAFEVIITDPSGATLILPVQVTIAEPFEREFEADITGNNAATLSGGVDLTQIGKPIMLQDIQNNQNLTGINNLNDLDSNGSVISNAVMGSGSALNDLYNSGTFTGLHNISLTQPVDIFSGNPADAEHLEPLKTTISDLESRNQLNDVILSERLLTIDDTDGILLSPEDMQLPEEGELVIEEEPTDENADPEEDEAALDFMGMVSQTSNSFEQQVEAMINALNNDRA